MKKILHIFLFAITLMIVLCLSASAAEINYTDENFIDWKVEISDFSAPLSYGGTTAHGSAIISGLNETEYTKDGFHMPTFITYDEKTYVVTSIKKSAFSGNNLVFGNVTFPTYLNKIGDSAFYTSICHR